MCVAARADDSIHQGVQGAKRGPRIHPRYLSERGLS